MPLRITLLAILVLVLTCTSPGSMQGVNAAEDRLVGGEFFHVVQPGETLTSIGARFGVAAGVLARENGLQASTQILEGLLSCANLH